jgi:hypothetical protein
MVSTRKTGVQNQCVKSMSNQGADIDGNGIVNAADLAYLLAGFNKRDVVAG